MEPVIALLVVLVALVILDVLALRFGHDSREGLATAPSERFDASR